MKKIKIVYNKKTKEIIPHIWEMDGTVTIITSGEYDWENIIVGMVDPDYIDFGHRLITEEPVIYEEEENRTKF